MVLDGVEDVLRESLKDFLSSGVVYSNQARPKEPDTEVLIYRAKEGGAVQVFRLNLENIKANKGTVLREIRLDDDDDETLGLHRTMVVVPSCRPMLASKRYCGIVHLLD